MPDKSSTELQTMLGKSLAKAGRLGQHGTQGAVVSVTQIDNTKNSAVTHDPTSKRPTSPSK